jgi:hypothetical protein
LAGEYAFSVPEISAVHADPKFVSWWYSLDGETFTQLTKVQEGNINLDGVWEKVFHANDSNPSYDDLVELQPNFTVSLTVDEGSEADLFMDSLSDKTKIWIGFKVVGPELDPGTNHLIRLNIPMFTIQPGPGDKNGVFGNTFSFELAHEPNFGLFTLEVINGLAAL